MSTPAARAVAAPYGPVVSCSSNENIFNTGYDAANGEILPNGSKDANWQVAGPFDTPGGTNPPSLASPPPPGTTFKAANVGNLRPVAWSASPYGNAQWISQQTIANPKQPNVNGDWYYEYQFTLDPSVNPSTFSLDMDFLADNEIAEVYVNGVAQSSKTTGLPQAPSGADPYHYMGFMTGNEAATTLDHDWQTGNNSMVVQIKSGYPYEGLDAQIRPSAICPVTLTVTKTAAPSPYLPGQSLTYTVKIANSGPGDADGVTVSDPLPEALANAGFAWTCISSTGSACSASGSAGITDTVDVAAGGELTYTLTGTVPAAASGTLTNIVTVTPSSGTEDAGCTPNCSATSSDPPATASLTVQKSSPTDGYSVVGNIVDYEFLVTNTGDVTLDDITVDDTQTPPASQADLSAVDCPAPTLAPTASETCTAGYRVTQADLDQGSLSDSAVASGTPRGGSAVLSPASTLTLRASPGSGQSGGSGGSGSGSAGEGKSSPPSAASSSSPPGASSTSPTVVTTATRSLAFTGTGQSLEWTAAAGAAFLAMSGLLVFARPRRRHKRPSLLSRSSRQPA